MPILMQIELSELKTFSTLDISRGDGGTVQAFMLLLRLFDAKKMINYRLYRRDEKELFEF